MILIDNVLKLLNKVGQVLENKTNGDNTAVMEAVARARSLKKACNITEKIIMVINRDMQYIPEHDQKLLKKYIKLFNKYD